MLKRAVPRRTALKGLLGGMGVSVGLPFLDCFLDGNGTALASGAPLPTRFGTWYWGCGHTPGYAVAEPNATKQGIDFLQECAPLAPYKQHINYFGGFNTPLDGLSNYVHHSGWVGSRTGTAPSSPSEIPAPTFDLLISDALGGGTRFRSLDLNSMGNANINYSVRNTYSRSAAEGSPLMLYSRVFGSGFTDPNNADFKPDPKVMVRKSVLSAVMEESKKVRARVGKSDQQRLDEYFNSVRQLENQLALQLEKPAPNQACVAPVDGFAKFDKLPPGMAIIDAVAENHRILTDILVMALACNQTKIFNIVFNDGFSGLRRAGDSNTHHTLTHEEETDPKLGYQPGAFWFNCQSMKGCADFIQAFTKIREGDKSLLDNTLVFAGSESSHARLHGINNLPMMTFGSAGGRIRTGLHVVGSGDPVTRVGLTVMRAMGLPIQKWGTKSLETSQPIGDVLI
ncbi:MAG: DUF1552 domain-containing protein [Rhodospirillaceae bacterium]|nr:DUF1552 domain-containing protein [Rhodospirillaceae bacterium]